MVYSNRKVEDQLLGYEIQEQGDYEICFNNRYSMLEHKRIFWQFEIEGAFDVAKAEEKLLNATVEFYNEASNQVQKVVRKVCKVCTLKNNTKLLFGLFTTISGHFFLNYIIIFHKSKC